MTWKEVAEGQRVTVSGYDVRFMGRKRLDGRTGTVVKKVEFPPLPGHEGSVYVRLDPKPRERTKKVELLLVALLSLLPDQTHPAPEMQQTALPRDKA